MNTAPHRISPPIEDDTSGPSHNIRPFNVPKLLRSTLACQNGSVMPVDAISAAIADAKLRDATLGWARECSSPLC